MSKVVVNGFSREEAEITISGFKHSFSPLMSASIILSSKFQLTNVPIVTEIDVYRTIFKYMNIGFKVNNHKVDIDSRTAKYIELDEELVNSIHGSIYLIPAMLCRFKKVKIGKTGGCQIGDNNGERPIEHIISVLKMFGAKFYEKSEYLYGMCNILKSCQIDIKQYSTQSETITGPYISGATKVAMLAGCVAEGKTIIRNPYNKMDIIDLFNFLKKSGVNIEWIGNEIIINGRQKMAFTKYNISPDLIEFATFLTLSAFLKKPLFIKCDSIIIKEGLREEIKLWKKMNIDFSFTNQGCYVNQVRSIQPTNIIVTPNTIFSDCQPLYALLLSQANSESMIEERVWKNRFSYTYELNKIGFNITVFKNKCFISKGVFSSTEHVLKALDLRAASTLIIASLILDTKTKIDVGNHLERGYERFIYKLKKIGCDIDIYE